jgi:hypothetical protein
VQRIQHPHQAGDGAVDRDLDTQGFGFTHHGPVDEVDLRAPFAVEVLEHGGAVFCGFLGHGVDRGQRIGVAQPDSLLLRHRRRLPDQLGHDGPAVRELQQPAVGKPGQGGKGVDAGIDDQLAPHQPVDAVLATGFQPGGVESLHERGQLVVLPVGHAQVSQTGAGMADAPGAEIGRPLGGNPGGRPSGAEAAPQDALVSQAVLHGHGDRPFSDNPAEPAGHRLSGRRFDKHDENLGPGQLFRSVRGIGAAGLFAPRGRLFDYQAPLPYALYMLPVDVVQTNLVSRPGEPAPEQGTHGSGPHDCDLHLFKSFQAGRPCRLSAAFTPLTTARAITAAASAPIRDTSSCTSPVARQNTTSPSPRVWIGWIVRA